MDSAPTHVIKVNLKAAVGRGRSEARLNPLRMTLKSEIEQIRAGPGEPVPMAIAFALAFGVGVAVKEILDSRTAGAVAWILVFTGFVALGVARSLVIHPARITRRSPL